MSFRSRFSDIAAAAQKEFQQMITRQAKQQAEEAARREQLLQRARERAGQIVQAYITIAILKKPSVFNWESTKQTPLCVDLHNWDDCIEFKDIQEICTRLEIESIFSFTASGSPCYDCRGGCKCPTWQIKISIKPDVQL